MVKTYTVYVCETCGKESKDSSIIKQCEASHLGLSVEELEIYKKLQDNAEYCGRIVASSKNDRTEKLFDDAINRLCDFEKEHNLV